jgi:hypothetical protein
VRGLDQAAQWSGSCPDVVGILLGDLFVRPNVANKAFFW